MKAAAEGQHQIGRTMPVQNGSYVDDYLLAHVDAPFNGRRAHMGQQDRPALPLECEEPFIHRRLVRENVERGKLSAEKGSAGRSSAGNLSANKWHAGKLSAGS